MPMCPALLSLPYLEALRKYGYSLSEYQEICCFQQIILFSLKENAAEGNGGPHAGMDMIWPLSIIMRGLTSNNDAEIKHCLRCLKNTNADTGFMHESFHKDDPSKFTRKWFAWANTLFGELIIRTV